MGFLVSVIKADLMVKAFDWGPGNPGSIPDSATDFSCGPGQVN